MFVLSSRTFIYKSFDNKKRQCHHAFFQFTRDGRYPKCDIYRRNSYKICSGHIREPLHMLNNVWWWAKTVFWHSRLIVYLQGHALWVIFTSSLLGVGRTCQRIIDSKQTVTFSNSRSLLNLVVDAECCGIIALKVCDYLHKRILFIIQMINNDYKEFFFHIFSCQIPDRA